MAITMTTITVNTREMLNEIREILYERDGSAWTQQAILHLAVSHLLTELRLETMR